MVMKQPTSSNILVILTDGDSLCFPELEVAEMFYEGESAEYEHDAGMLEDAIAPLFRPDKPGTYFLHGFTAHYSKDYWGEVDADYALEGWREATADDEKRFYTDK